MAANARCATSLDWPFFEPRHRAFAARARRVGGDDVGHAHGDDRESVDAACRALVARARRGRLARATRSPAAPTAAPPTRSTRARSASRARRSRATTASPTSRSRCRASARARSASPARDEQKARYLPRVARGEAIAAFALSEPDAGSDVAAMACAARARRRRLRARRREDLDLERRHRRLLRRLRAHRRRERSGAKARAASPPSSSTPTRRASSIAERIDVIAPHPLARLRFDGLPHPRDAAHRRRRRGLQGRDAHARRLPHLGRRRRARLRAPRVRRGAGARHVAARCSAASSADFQLTQAKLAQMATDDRLRRAAHLPRRLAARPGRRTSRARRRWPSSPRPKARSR